MRVAILGAGLAGLAAACELADRGHVVTIFERRPWAGGKTYSVPDREAGEPVDNGQHIFMNCTSAYVAFLEKLGTLALTKRQARLRVPVIDSQGRRSDLWAAALPAPFHLLPSFVAYRHLTASEKARITRAMLALTRRPQGDGGACDETFEVWLRRHGQTNREIERFWNLIIVPTLNCAADQAGAAQALFVFREGFLRSAGAAAIGVPRVGLSELHVHPALAYIERRGGSFRPHAEVETLQVTGAEVAAVRTKGGAWRQFDAYVAALPPRDLLAILPPALRPSLPFAALAQLQYDPIVNLHVWLDAAVADFDFAAFTGSEIQWVFNRTRIETQRPRSAEAYSAAEHLVISLSNAERYLDLGRGALEQRFLAELRRVLPRSRSAHLLRFAAVKEPEATFRPAPGIHRPGPLTPVRNLFLAGAYTATGWPATMESAVRSGVAAAAAVCKFRAAPSFRVPAAVP